MRNRNQSSLSAVISKVQRETSQPCALIEDTRRRTKSFGERLTKGVVQRAEQEGVIIELKDEPDYPPPPPPKKKSKTVLPAAGPRRVKHGIQLSTGVFALVHEMQQLDDSALLLFYLEVSREYEERTEDAGWTNMVMEHVMSRCQCGVDASTPEHTQCFDESIVEETPCEA